MGKQFGTKGLGHLASTYVDIVSEGIFLYDPEKDQFRFHNKALEDIISIDPLYEGEDLLSIVHKDDKDRISAIFEDCRRNVDGEVRDVEVRILKGSDQIHWINLRCLPVSTDEGDLIAGSIRDVNSLHKARRDAQFYLDLMTHDLTNKHQVILMNLEILKGLAVKDDDTARRFGSTVRHLGEAMDTIRSVKVLADVGLGPFEGEELLLKEEIEKGADILRSFDPLVKMDLEIDLHDEDEKVLADKRLKLVFYHLMANCVLHNDNDLPRIRVCSSEDKGRVRVSFRDNGPGIPGWIKSELKGIEFLNIERARGRGLGLPLVASLVDFYGGAMEVADIEENGSVSGAVVTVLLDAT